MGLLRPTHLSRAGAQFIGRFEGLRLSPYNDAVGNATIGYGHLIHYGNVTPADVRKYRVFSAASALGLLQADAEVAAKSVAAIRPAIRSQARFDALVSLAFNLGTGILGPSHTIGAAVRTLTRKGAADAFLLYDFAGTTRLPGLTARREAERKLWLTGSYN